MLAQIAGQGQRLSILFEPSRLWSLWDMLRIHADKYIELGQWMYDSRLTFGLDGYTEDDGNGAKRLNAKGREILRLDLQKLLEVSNDLSLPMSKSVISRRLLDLPQSEREISLLMEVLAEELKTQLFLFVPAHRAKYFEMSLPPPIQEAFPSASAEIRLAGNSLTSGLYTASVFHSMRATELGIRAMATALNVTFSYPIELAEWGKIVGELEPKINELKVGPRSIQKDEDLKFYSEAASQFRHFNNGWRVRVSHARASYDEPQAIGVMEHVLSFFETLATRLKEA